MVSSPLFACSVLPSPDCLVSEPGARPCADEIIYNRLFDDVRQGEPSLCSTPFDMSFEALAVDLPPHEAVTALRELVWQQCHEE
jgi:hypothetical protein